MGPSEAVPPEFSESQHAALDFWAKGTKAKEDPYLLGSLLVHRAGLENWTKSTPHTLKAIRYAKLACYAEELFRKLGVDINLEAIRRFEQEEYDITNYKELFKGDGVDPMLESHPKYQQLCNEERNIGHSKRLLLQQTTHFIKEAFRLVGQMDQKVRVIYIDVACCRITEFVNSVDEMRHIVKSQLGEDDFKIPELLAKLSGDAADAFYAMIRGYETPCCIYPEDPKDTLADCQKTGKIPKTALLMIVAERQDYNSGFSEYAQQMV